jgi:hypothetical protein
MSRYIIGKITDDVYERRPVKYEREQKELVSAVSEAKTVLESAEQKTTDLRLLP